MNLLQKWKESQFKSNDYYLLLFAIIYKNLIFGFIIISVFENECQFAENDEGKT